MNVKDAVKIKFFLSKDILNVHNFLRISANFNTYNQSRDEEIKNVMHEQLVKNASLKTAREIFLAILKVHCITPDTTSEEIEKIKEFYRETEDEHAKTLGHFRCEVYDDKNECLEVLCWSIDEIFDMFDWRKPCEPIKLAKSTNIYPDYPFYGIPIFRNLDIPINAVLKNMFNNKKIKKHKTFNEYQYDDSELRRNANQKIELYEKKIKLVKRRDVLNIKISKLENSGLYDDIKSLDLKMQDHKTYFKSFIKGLIKINSNDKYIANLEKSINLISEYLNDPECKNKSLINILEKLRKSANKLPSSQNYIFNEILSYIKQLIPDISYNDIYNIFSKRGSVCPLKLQDAYQDLKTEYLKLPHCWIYSTSVLMSLIKLIEKLNRIEYMKNDIKEINKSIDDIDRRFPKTLKKILLGNPSPIKLSTKFLFKIKPTGNVKFLERFDSNGAIIPSTSKREQNEFDSVYYPFSTHVYINEQITRFCKENNLNKDEALNKIFKFVLRIYKYNEFEDLLMRVISSPFEDFLNEVKRNYAKNKSYKYWGEWDEWTEWSEKYDPSFQYNNNLCDCINIEMMSMKQDDDFTIAEVVKLPFIVKNGTKILKGKKIQKYKCKECGFQFQDISSRKIHQNRNDIITMFENGFSLNQIIESTEKSYTEVYGVIQKAYKRIKEEVNELDKFYHFIQNFPSGSNYNCESYIDIDDKYFIAGFENEYKKLCGYYPRKVWLTGNYKSVEALFLFDFIYHRYSGEPRFTVDELPFYFDYINNTEQISFFPAFFYHNAKPKQADEVITANTDYDSVSFAKNILSHYWANNLPLDKPSVKTDQINKTDEEISTNTADTKTIICYGEDDEEDIPF